MMQTKFLSDTIMIQSVVLSEILMLQPTFVSEILMIQPSFLSEIRIIQRTFLSETLKQGRRLIFGMLTVLTNIRLPKVIWLMEAVFPTKSNSNYNYLHINLHNDGGSRQKSNGEGMEPSSNK